MDIASEDLTDSHSDDGDSPTLSTILAFLVRTGQIQVERSVAQEVDDQSDSDEDYSSGELVGMGQTGSMLCCPLKPDTTQIEGSDLQSEILRNSGRSELMNSGKSNKPPDGSHRAEPQQLNSVTKITYQRQMERFRFGQFSHGDKCVISSRYLPNKREIVAAYRNKAFCGTYSQDGNIFISACQDQKIRVYNTSGDRWKLLKTIQAKDVGWSILDIAFSPDSNYLVYSSWSDNIHLCNVHGENDIHTSLCLNPSDSRFCIFSLMFSQDNREILGGASDRCLYVYDRERDERTLQISAHGDDVNTVAFADDSTHILFSGGDDGLVKVWDRRSLSEHNPHSVGTFAGHHDGITFVNSKGDGRYVISNCKDQSIKLWDLRHFSTRQAQEQTMTHVAKQLWDYRWQSHPKKDKIYKPIVGDSSIMTYMGHSILHTLIRCRFSPEFTTGQRYIYTGCAAGNIVVYDLLTGQVETRLSGQRACVRDVSWHPYDNNIVGTSWDGSISRWYYFNSSSDDFDDLGQIGQKKPKLLDQGRLAGWQL